MKPIADTTGTQEKPYLPPKPLKYRTSLSKTPSEQPDLLPPSSRQFQRAPVQPSPRVHKDQTIPLPPSPKVTKDHEAFDPPSPERHSDRQATRVTAPMSRHTSDDRRSKLCNSPPRPQLRNPTSENPLVHNRHPCESPSYSTSGARTSTGPSDCNHSAASSAETPSSVTSSEGVSDVIYDEPFVELERKSLERLIKSDGYVKLRSDVVGEAVAKQHQPHSRARNHANADPSKAILRPCRSSESVDKLDVLVDFGNTSCPLFPAGKLIRSSFVDPNGPPTRKSVYIELGEYQTLLKHSRNEEERVYSLPQPQCYGEDTLRAVKLITQKYDTFKRRQLRALSFREGTCATRRSLDEEGDGARATPEESNNNKTANTTAPSTKAAAAAVAEVTESPKETESDGANDHKLKPGNEETDGKKAAALHKPAVEKSTRSRQSGWISLRDYCNTLATDVDASCENGGGLSRANLMRIELFYRSHEATVYVCRSLADMFIGTSLSDDSCPLVHQHTGVPVWLLNSGTGVRKRELLLVVAERETGFPLWQDKINYLSNYHEQSPGVHALRVSGSLRKMVRLHMFCQRAGEEFLARFHQIAFDPQDDLWKVSSDDAKSRKTGKNKKKKRRSRLSKTSISQPCNFVHISCVDPTDPNFRAAFSGLVPLTNGRSPTNSEDQSKAFDSTDQDKNKAFDSVDRDKTGECADDSCASCEFRPRLPTR